MTEQQRQIERAANAAARRAKKAKRGNRMRTLILAQIARTEALRTGPVAR